MTFEIHRGDTAPSFRRRLRNDIGETVPLTNAQEVDFHMRSLDYDTTVDDNTTGNVSIVDGPSGEVQYSWQSGDTDSVGTYRAEFVVTFSDGTIRTFPVGGTYTIIVTEDIND